MPTSFLVQTSYCSLNSCAQRVALVFRIVRQLQKDSSNVTAAVTESPKSQITNTDHRLNGSSSHVLTATPRSYGNNQNSTFCKIKTPERILTKFGTVDYLPEMCQKTTFSDNWMSGGLWGNMWNIRSLLLSLLFPRTDLEVPCPHQFWCKIAWIAWIEAQMCLFSKNWNYTVSQKNQTRYIFK